MLVSKITCKNGFWIINGDLIPSGKSFRLHIEDEYGTPEGIKHVSYSPPVSVSTLKYSAYDVDEGENAKIVVQGPNKKKVVNVPNTDDNAWGNEQSVSLPEKPSPEPDIFDWVKNHMLLVGGVVGGIIFVVLLVSVV